MRDRVVSIKRQVFWRANAKKDQNVLKVVSVMNAIDK